MREIQFNELLHALNLCDYAIGEHLQLFIEVIVEVLQLANFLSAQKQRLLVFLLALEEYLDLRDQVGVVVLQVAVLTH
jgi:hypothetical protein